MAFLAWRTTSLITYSARVSPRSCVERRCSPLCARRTHRGWPSAALLCRGRSQPTPTTKPLPPSPAGRLCRRSSRGCPCGLSSAALWRCAAPAHSPLTVPHRAPRAVHSPPLPRQQSTANRPSPPRPACAAGALLRLPPTHEPRGAPGRRERPLRRRGLCRRPAAGPLEAGPGRRSLRGARRPRHRRDGARPRRPPAVPPAVVHCGGGGARCAGAVQARLGRRCVAAAADGGWGGGGDGRRRGGGEGRGWCGPGSRGGAAAAGPAGVGCCAGVWGFRGGGGWEGEGERGPRAERGRKRGAARRGRWRWRRWAAFEGGARRSDAGAAQGGGGRRGCVGRRPASGSPLVAPRRRVHGRRAPAPLGAALRRIPPRAGGARRWVGCGHRCATQGALALTAKRAPHSVLHP